MKYKNTNIKLNPDDNSKNELSQIKKDSGSGTKYQQEPKKVDASSEIAKKKIKVNQIDIEDENVITTSDNKIIKKIVFEDTFNVEFNTEKYDTHIK